jgi:putative nucleotidyltransferase with HDIG domain
VRSIDDGVQLECDLFIRHPRGDYVLYLAAEAPFAGVLRRELHERAVRTLYVAEEQATMLTGYYLARMSEVVLDPTMSVERRSSAAFEGAQFLLDRVFADPRAEVVTEMERGVKLAVDLALKEPDAARNLMALTRHDAYTYNHSMNVSIFGMALAFRIGTENEWKHRVAQGLFLHDVGKTRIPKEVINAPGKLSPDQWALMKQHPELGIEVLEETGRRDPIARRITIQHHERNDGRGYPLGLRGHEISLEGKICTIADVFDALTTDRSYRKAMPIFQGLQLMINEMRNEFDPDICELFIRLFQKQTPDAA